MTVCNTRGVPEGSLREEALALVRRSGTRSRVDVLLDQLGGVERAEVVELLTGEPLLPHRVVATVLDRHFRSRVGGQITEGVVQSWRARNIAEVGDG